MPVTIGRRELIAALGGAAAAWPLSASAQQSAVPVVGYLDAGLPRPNAPLVALFRQSLAEAGYVEGRNVAIEYHWAEGRYDQLPAMAAELVRRQPAVPRARLYQHGLLPRAALSEHVAPRHRLCRPVRAHPDDRAPHRANGGRSRHHSGRRRTAGRHRGAQTILARQLPVCAGPRTRRSGIQALPSGGDRQRRDAALEQRRAREEPAI